MKKIILCVVLIVVSIMIFTSCGRAEESNSKIKEYFVIDVTESEFVMPEAGSDWYMLGSHFLNDTAIQIWGHAIRNEQGTMCWDVYVYSEDGIFEYQFGGVSTYYRNGWYMDKEGNFYIAMGNELMKLDGEGNEVFHRISDRTFHGMYQDANGSMKLLSETEGGALVVSSVNGETGELKDTESVVVKARPEIYYLTVQQDGIYMLDRQGVWKLNQESDAKEEVISFSKKGYTLEVAPKHFEVTDDNVVQMLLNNKKVILTQRNIAETRTVLTMFSVSDLQNVEDAIEKFNEENDTYYVVYEHPEEDEDVSALKTQLNIEIATGGGPDLLFVGGSIVPDNIWDYVSKGAFVKLNSYMEQSGITEENYFPLTFNGLTEGDSIYGVSLLAQLSGCWVSAEVLQGNESPTIEEFVDALLAYEGEAVLSDGMTAQNLPHMFFMASDSLCGAVDWETGTCNFYSELFRKILQVCKRYGDDGSNDYPALTGQIIGGLYNTATNEEYIAQGKVPVWYFFDEGCYPGSRIKYTLAINSNSPYQDAAWMVLEYLLDGDLQSTSTFAYSLYPVKRSGFEELMRREMEETSLTYRERADGFVYIYAKAGTDGYKNLTAVKNDADNYRAMHDITEEKAEQFRWMLENAKTMPVRTEEIQNIVLEEAGAYFANARSLDDVCALIQNRVQLYLDEWK